MTNPTELFDALMASDRALKVAIAHLGPFGGRWTPCPSIHNAPSETVAAALQIAASHRIVPRDGLVYDEITIDLGGAVAGVYGVHHEPQTDLERQVAMSGEPAFIVPERKVA